MFCGCGQHWLNKHMMIHSLVLCCPLVDIRKLYLSTSIKNQSPWWYLSLYRINWKWTRPVRKAAILLPEWRSHTRLWAVQRWTVSGRIDRWVCVRGLCGSNHQEPAPSAKGSIHTHYMLICSKFLAQLQAQTCFN